MLVAICTAYGQGTIVYSVPSQPLYYGPNASQYNIDVNGDGADDFILVSDGNFRTTLEPLGNNRLIAYSEPPPDVGSILYAFPQNYSVGSSLNPILQWYDRNTDPFHNVLVGQTVGIDNGSSTIGFFTGASSAYAGFDLYYDGASHYGWFQVSNPFEIAAGEFLDWAYQTSPNTPIFTGVVPEPSTVTLTVLGVLVFWIRYQRSK